MEDWHPRVEDSGHPVVNIRCLFSRPESLPALQALRNSKAKSSYPYIDVDLRWPCPFCLDVVPFVCSTPEKRNEFLRAAKH